MWITEAAIDTWNTAPHSNAAPTCYSPPREAPNPTHSTDTVETLKRARPLHISPVGMINCAGKRTRSDRSRGTARNMRASSQFILNPHRCIAASDCANLSYSVRRRCSAGPDVRRRKGLWNPPPGASDIEIAGELFAVGADVARISSGDFVWVLGSGGATQSTPSRASGSP